VKRSNLGINILGVIAGALMIAAMFFPWWSFKLSYTKTTNLYPYLIDGPFSELIGYKRSPQMTILTGVLIVCIGLCFLGSVVKGRGARIMLAISGILCLLGTWRLLIRVTGVAARFGLPIQGHGWGQYGGFARVEVFTWLQPGTYLMITGGILAILASLIVWRIPKQYESRLSPVNEQSTKIEVM
jgi:uncharacterized membrane protein